MTQTTFNIYQGTDGILRLDNFSKTFNNQDWEQYLRESGQSQRADYLMSLSARKRSGKVYRIRQSEDFRQWSESHVINITSTLYGTASAEYDGRIPEGCIKYAILQALKDGKAEAKYYPVNNSRKPAYLHMVYVFTYSFTRV